MAVTQVGFSDPSAAGNETILSRLGIPQALVWGFLGLLLFMIGDGVESGYLSPFLTEHGLSQTSVAWIFTTYGLSVGVAGWLSGALSDIWGPRRVIIAGLLSWVFFEILFLTVGLRSGNIFLILLTYGLRGLGYPLFAFGFLVWITVVAPHQRLASAMGWFWFAFTGGLPTLGSIVASYCVPRIGAYYTLWLSTALVLLGGLTLLVGVRESRGRTRLVPAQDRPLHALLCSITLAWRTPKTGIACLVRVINTAPEFGFFVFLPAFFTGVIGFTMQEWLLLLSAIFLSNIIWNLLFGLIGDRLGWRKTVAFFGGFGCALTTLGLYYSFQLLSPQLSPDSRCRSVVWSDARRICSFIGIDAKPGSGASRRFAESIEPWRGSKRMGRARARRSSLEASWGCRTDVGVCHAVSSKRFSGAYFAAAT